METGHAAETRLVRLMFGGDAMVGRTVATQIQRHGAGYPLGGVEALMRAADLTIVNLECAITAAGALWSGAPKAFYFGAPPEAVQTLVRAGVDLVSLANNHVLDFDRAGLDDTLRLLHRYGIAQAGAGRDLAAARRPAIVERAGLRFGMAAFCDHQKDFAAGPHTSGIAYLDLDNEAHALACMHDALTALRHAEVDYPILSLHWGANMVLRPPPRFRRLAHAAIDMGWKILFGHSAHVFHGVEWYRGCPIIYAAGDLVDDYYVDPQLRNDRQFLFELELEAGRVRAIVLHPLMIENCRALPADRTTFDALADRMTLLCREMGSEVQQCGDGCLRIEAVPAETGNASA